jgi:hypothetical protein
MLCIHVWKSKGGRTAHATCSSGHPTAEVICCAAVTLLGLELVVDPTPPLNSLCLGMNRVAERGSLYREASTLPHDSSTVALMGCTLPRDVNHTEVQSEGGDSEVELMEDSPPKGKAPARAVAPRRAAATAKPKYTVDRWAACWSSLNCEGLFL